MRLKYYKGNHIIVSWSSCESSTLFELEFGDVGFCLEGRKPENSEKNPGTRREPTTN